MNRRQFMVLGLGALFSIPLRKVKAFKHPGVYTNFSEFIRNCGPIVGISPVEQIVRGGYLVPKEYSQEILRRFVNSSQPTWGLRDV